MKAVQTDLFKEISQLYSVHEILIGMLTGRIFDVHGKKVTVKRYNENNAEIVEIE